MAALDTENAEVQQFWKRQIRGEARHFWRELVLLTLRELDTPGIAALHLRFTAASEACNTCLKGNTKDTAPTFNDTMCLLFELLGLCMTSGNPPIHRKLKFSSNGTWPERASDILPYGIEASFFGLFFWWKRIDSLHVDRALSYWLFMFHNDLRPIITRDRDTLVPSLITGLSYSVDRVEISTRTGTYTSIDGDNLSTRFMLAREFITEFKAPAAGTTTAADGYEQETIKVVERVVSVFNKLSSNGLQHSFNLKEFQGALSMVMVLKMRIGQKPSKADFQALFSPYSTGRAAVESPGDAYIYMSFRGHVLAFRSRPQCDESSCTRYGRSDASKLQKCGRCLSVTYYSSACQRAHWRAAVRPHKISCPLFAELRAIAAFESDPGHFSAAYEAAHVTYGQMSRAVYYFMCLFNRLEESHTSTEETKIMEGKFSIQYDAPVE